MAINCIQVVVYTHSIYRGEGGLLLLLWFTEDFAFGQGLLQFINLRLGKGGVIREIQLR